MNVADARADCVDLAGAQQACPLRDEMPLRVAAEALDLLGAAQDADQTPDGVIVDRGRLPRTPDEADDAEALAAVAVEQILLVAVGCGRA